MSLFVLGAAHHFEGGITVTPSSSTSVRIGAVAALGRRTTIIPDGFEWEACNLADQACSTPGHLTDSRGGTIMTTAINKRILAAAAILAVGCSDSNPAGPDYNPVIPTHWAATVSNPYFELAPGTTWQYTGETSEGTETITVEVLSETRQINGVTATIVRDRVFLEGDLIEDTFDWYAEDSEGNVWYLGEDSKEIENGMVVSTEGSWEWTNDGALPGIIMRADPATHIGEEYRQEFYEGEAEDWAKVVAVNQSVTVPFGNFTGCVQIEEWNGLEPVSREHKYFCREVGQVLEVSVGSGERVELTGRTGP